MCGLFELDALNAARYLQSARGLDPESVRITPLGGGISNTVLLVEPPGAPFVLKQALGKLRVEQDWFSDRHRIFRECEALRRLAPHLEPGAVPDVLFEDRENCLFAMSAAPPSAQSWKSLLLGRVLQTGIAARVARMLAGMIRLGWRNPEFEGIFGDQTVFDQLRLDPYYRSTAARHPDLRPHFDRLIGDCRGFRLTLVHGDWSPKNFLVDGSSAMAIDFEVIHYGDPAFDAAFLLNHLLLKSFHLPEVSPEFAVMADVFWRTLLDGLPAEAAGFEERTIRHLGGLLLARIDGKSPAEYIRDAGARDEIRSFARRLILTPPTTVQEIFRRPES